ncbi:uncharacterized protein N7483_003636 [Penicillium malachiteum]|uniref:uncharacterized protein n=1 Tax=Penicillium malachiteum TaxID=1324776 RepID=UPI00254977BC|nr:uncharacterized protein N7483_003636 [Penicillium malachiteum]KAJ5729128.1 hypothetical protein N7483_003636 [Penicillium malachiteum]
MWVFNLHIGTLYPSLEDPRNKHHPSIPRLQPILSDYHELDIATVSEEFLVDLCHRTEKEVGRIDREEYRPRVVRISEHIAVKYGCGVTAPEAATQDFAYRMADPRIVHIPRVYRYIQVDSEGLRSKGYIFMEYIPGKSLSDVDIESDANIVVRLAKVILHLSEIKGDTTPGPFGGGRPQGYIWGDDGAKTEFHSLEEMNVYMDKRLARRYDTIDLTPYPLVLCHLDMCRRNVILEEDNKSLCPVDWAYAGLYPRLFEFAMIPCTFPYDEAFEKPFMQELEILMNFTAEEKQFMTLVRCVRAANLRWIL